MFLNSLCNWHRNTFLQHKRNCGQLNLNRNLNFNVPNVKWNNKNKQKKIVHYPITLFSSTANKVSMLTKWFKRMIWYIYPIWRNYNKIKKKNFTEKNLIHFWKWVEVFVCLCVCVCVLIKSKFRTKQKIVERWQKSPETEFGLNNRMMKKNV